MQRALSQLRGKCRTVGRDLRHRLRSREAKRAGRPLRAPQWWGRHRVFATTVIRGAASHEMTGYLLELDWARGEVRHKLPIRLNNDSAFWNRRGGNRGGRGVAAFGDRLYVATATAVLVYDPWLNPVGEIHNPLFAGLHEIAVDEEGVWATSTVHDLILKVDFAGRTLRTWWGSESAPLQRALGYEGRTLNLDLSFPRQRFAEAYDAYCREERLHLNGVWQHEGAVYVLSSAKSAVIRILPGPEKLVLRDPRLAAPHNCVVSREGRLVLNDTKHQAVRVYDLQSGRVLRSIRTPVHGDGRSADQFATAGWQRGLWQVEGPLFLVGTSPAAVFELDIERARVGRVLRIDTDVRHCIHGLSVARDFAAAQARVA